MTRCYKVAQYVMKCINGSDNMRMFAVRQSGNNILYIKTIRKHRYLPALCRRYTPMFPE